MLRCLLAPCLVALIPALSVAAPSVTGKKLIASGWHMPNAEYIREHVAEMERLPFDGLLLNGDPFYPFRSPMEADDPRFEPYVRNLSHTRFERFTDNFMTVEVGNDGRFDWFDAPEWLPANFRLLADVAKRAGLKGIHIDPECYEGPSPFEYKQRKHADTKTAAEYAAQAERVGAETMRAIDQAFPDITLLWYFGPSAAGCPRNLEGWCGLAAPFIDGMLSECKPGALIVDAYEQAYGFRRPDQYANGRKLIKETCRKCSSVPDKYRRHLQVGFAVWPDNWHGAPPRRSFNADDLTQNYYTPDEVAYAAHNALAYSDQYVWVWTESLNWWQSWCWVYPDGKQTQKPLPPAYAEALAKARQPHVPAPPVRDLTTAAPPAKAADQAGYSDEETFGDLWAEYDEVCDLPLEWRFATDPKNEGRRKRWFAPEFDDSAWKPIRIGEFWEPQGFGNYDGVGWYRVDFRPPAVPLGKRLYLAFGAADEAAWVYVDGKLAGAHDVGEQGWTQRFLIDVTDRLSPDHESLIAVRVKDTTGAGGLWKSIKLVSAK